MFLPRKSPHLLTNERPAQERQTSLGLNPVSIQYFLLISLVEFCSVWWAPDKNNYRNRWWTYKQDIRLPVAYFPRPNFHKYAFRRLKVFSLINTRTSGKFLIFPNLKVSWFFFAKKINLWGKKTFLRNNIILFEFYCKYATFTDFEKKSNFFLKKFNFFQKFQSSYVFEKNIYFSRS